MLVSPLTEHETPYEEAGITSASNGQSTHSSSNSVWPAGQGGKAATRAGTEFGPPSSWPSQPEGVGKKPVGQKQSCSETAEPVDDWPGIGHSSQLPSLLKEPFGHASIVGSGVSPKSRLTCAERALPRKFPGLPTATQTSLPSEAERVRLAQTGKGVDGITPGAAASPLTPTLPV